MDVEYLRTWIGKPEEKSDTIARTPVLELAAVLNRTKPEEMGEVLPPLWHWMFFQQVVRQSDLGTDGHARLGQFLPPIPLPRRMWAGSRIQFHKPLQIGQKLVRNSVICAVDCKQGRSGPLVFVTVRHQIKNSDGAEMLTEEHDIIYRDRPNPSTGSATPVLPPAEPQWTEEVRPDSSLLFRYSALTFNAHRIHYDRPYATEIEGYPGLVVHGPLIATLLLESLEKQRPGAQVATFSFRAISPLFDTEPFMLCGCPGEKNNTVVLWAQKQDGSVALLAHAILA